jgi:hypothetical protein
MKKQQKHKQDPLKRQPTLFDFAEGVDCYDTLSDPLKEQVSDLDKQKDSRDILAEMKTDVLFHKAAQVLTELLDSDDDFFRLKAASEVLKMRAATLKANKRNTGLKEAVEGLRDGFNFV